MECINLLALSRALVGGCCCTPMFNSSLYHFSSNNVELRLLQVAVSNGNRTKSRRELHRFGMLAKKNKVFLFCLFWKWSAFFYLQKPSVKNGLLGRCRCSWVLGTNQCASLHNRRPAAGVTVFILLIAPPSSVFGVFENKLGAKAGCFKSLIW